MNNEYVKYLLVLALLVAVLGLYANNYSHWRGKFETVPLSFKLVVLHTLRFMSTLVSLLNFALYVDGSYFLVQAEYNVSNVFLIVMIAISVACIVSLYIVKNGYKLACTPVIHSRRSSFYEE
jgi:hypothetical protein